MSKILVFFNDKELTALRTIAESEYRESSDCKTVDCAYGTATSRLVI